eukprot:735992-Hanusia_phi.AAC.1
MEGNPVTCALSPTSAASVRAPTLSSKKLRSSPLPPLVSFPLLVLILCLVTYPLPFQAAPDRAVGVSCQRLRGGGVKRSSRKEDPDAQPVSLKHVSRPKSRTLLTGRYKHLPNEETAAWWRLLDGFFERRGEGSEKKHTESRIYGKRSVNRTFTLKKLQHGTKREQKKQTKAIGSSLLFERAQYEQELDTWSYLEYLFGTNDKGISSFSSQLNTGTKHQKGNISWKDTRMRMTMPVKAKEMHLP